MFLLFKEGSNGETVRLSENKLLHEPLPDNAGDGESNNGGEGAVGILTSRLTGIGH